MKTQEEIDEVYKKLYLSLDDSPHYHTWVRGYTQCQEDMELATWDTTLTDGLEEIEWDTKPGFVEKRMALRAQSAKNKAEKLISKYNLVVLDTALGGSNQRAKECALIEVDEIINTLNSDIKDLDVRGNILLDLIEYWREVKQEIEKL